MFSLLERGVNVNPTPWALLCKEEFPPKRLADPCPTAGRRAPRFVAGKIFYLDSLPPSPKGTSVGRVREGGLFWIKLSKN